jgi:hypothetical protein
MSLAVPCRFICLCPVNRLLSLFNHLSNLLEPCQFLLLLETTVNLIDSRSRHLHDMPAVASGSIHYNKGGWVRALPLVVVEGIGP